MLEAVEKRYGRCLAPEEAVEMLSDNGAPYTARETRIFARQLGLKPCFTPVKSPRASSEHHLHDAAYRLIELFPYIFKLNFQKKNNLWATSNKRAQGSSTYH